jgi:large subunit ribosomal protein L25
MAKTKQSNAITLTVQRRTINGKRPVRRLRGDGVVPGVVYGRKMDPVSVAVNQRELSKVLHSTRGERALVTLRLEDASPWEKPVLVKWVQHDPVDGHILHVDFQAIVLTERLRVRVPVVLKGVSVGVKQDGGLMEHFLREVEVECLPTEIPSGVEFDVSALKIGDTVHVRDLTPPAQAKITSDAEGVIVAVQMPKEEKPEEAAEAVTEPEVIREKKEEAEAPAEAAKGEKSDAKKDKEAKT